MIPAIGIGIGIAIGIGIGIGIGIAIAIGIGVGVGVGVGRRTLLGTKERARRPQGVASGHRIIKIRMGVRAA
jgi:hypothetical protein